MLPLWIFIVVIVGALLALGSNIHSRSLKYTSDSLAARNQANAEKNQSRLDSVNRLIIALQSKTIDSSNLIIRLSKELNSAQIDVKRLQQQSFNYLLGSDEVPVLATSISDNSVIIDITNPDYKNPMYNMRIKRQEYFYPDIGTLYPRATRILERIDVPQGKNDGWYFVVWYNNNKTVEVDIDVTRDKQGYLRDSVRYINEKGKQFTPEWMKRPAKVKKNTVNPARTYNPREVF